MSGFGLRGLLSEAKAHLIKPLCAGGENLAARGSEGEEAMRNSTNHQESRLT
jgi:hypothetical protein